MIRLIETIPISDWLMQNINFNVVFCALCMFICV